MTLHQYRSRQRFSFVHVLEGLILPVFTSPFRCSPNLQHKRDMLNHLAEIKIPLMKRFDKWQAPNASSAKIRSVPESVSHTHPKKLAMSAERRNTQSRGANPPSSSSTPANTSDSQVTTNDAHTHSRTRTKGPLERHKQLVAPVLPDPADVVDVPSTKVAGASDPVNSPPFLIGKRYLSLVLLIYRRLLK